MKSSSGRAAPGLRPLLFILGVLGMSGFGRIAARDGVVPTVHRHLEISYGRRERPVDGAPQRDFLPVRLAFTASTLPPPYATVRLGDSIYYRAAGAYYVWSPLEEDYAIVATPPGIEFAVCSEVSAGVALFNDSQSAVVGRCGPTPFPRIEYALGALRLDLPLPARALAPPSPSGHQAADRKKSSVLRR
jgi:hypothetical protein